VARSVPFRAAPICDAVSGGESATFTVNRPDGSRQAFVASGCVLVGPPGNGELTIYDVLSKSLPQ
jgi:hypothetical protein